ncbi:3-methyladenine DNA glycosylase [Auritidibacter ignavus]|uniref:3-methyladenine DNA glycosylase n=2 Tax=Auritidibacter TaxID=1160973 RepID=A0AAJ6DBA8_9MICC|nr:3-methyladenine DNA glycosylase [Auritidibacter ignavus]WGH92189.1 3-methyladenine DNA glycosylase [Auritidibacter ignavus]
MHTATSPGTLTVVDAEDYRARSAAHSQRITELTRELFELRAAGIKHPIFDFMFSYYSFTAGALKRWHPGPHAVLLPDHTGQAPDHADYPHYRYDSDCGGYRVDTDSFRAKRQTAINVTVNLLAGTLPRRAQLSCFGLHEWAMAYRSDRHGIRHAQLPLRLGASGTDEVVESHKITCTHFDAYRFYAPEAKPLNQFRPTRKRAPELEQPGCLHANMDLYRHSYKMVPLVDSDLMAETFELAWQIRVMDMRASPYDLSDWGLDPIRIETRDGKAEYTRLQKEFSERAQVLRARLLEVLTPWSTL